MTDQYILSIDPGVSNGLALGVIGDSMPYKAVMRFQFSGGALGLHAWIKANYDCLRRDYHVLVCAEKFIPLQNKGFAQTLGSTMPLVCEGVLLADGVMPDYPSKEWVPPRNQYLYGGKDLAEKKKLAKDFLKANGMYLTGKDVSAPDAADAISATLHGISYAAKTLKHRPTWEMISEMVN